MKRVQLISEAKKEVALKIFREYQKEWARFDETVKFDDDGNPIYPWFDWYWTDKSYYPFFLKDNDDIAGLCFMREIEPARYAVAEFYLMPEFRIGDNALLFANLAIGLFEGIIEFSTLHKNTRAKPLLQKFFDGFDCEKKTWNDETRIFWVIGEEK